ncbi:GntR family transcriptional regulator [Marinovum sp. 2_MG-2023]|uniref:GntR family transcriptional regulator n=1 Tax=unclassified Marinovum TaxID=2647166 RepID=UPI0026E1AD67|nr:MULTISPECIES: GntR family transcriptional regulator [unclassified Marinovum]MDO6732549.1 GntR family transcriptional regulator [Marinovum sp. 2_MG-2023]MDO6781819.1 GntR family transcriptional regulator [Marinovum sp. 1_MG-2023]
MSRDSSTFKESYNQALDIVRSAGVSGALPTESALSKTLAVSRTTVRAILTNLDEAGIIKWEGRHKLVLRAPKKSDYFGKSETASATEKVSSQFMEYVLNSDLAPGTALHESDLKKEFNASSSVIREFLIKFSRFGLITKERNRSWMLRGFTRDFAEELFDVREMFELRAFDHLLRQGAGSESHQAVIALAPQHEDILAQIDRDYLAFPRLDERFHRALIETYDNRFMTDFFEVVAMVFHYHYRWNRVDEKERNRDAILEHLTIIRALESGDLEAANTAFRKHLNNAKNTMTNSALWD